MTDALHTVEVTVPGTQTRVLVERLLGTRADALDIAREVFDELQRAKHLVARVVRSDEITDVPSSPLETT